jgi:hypothetical protein
LAPDRSDGAAPVDVWIVAEALIRQHEQVVVERAAGAALSVRRAPIRSLSRALTDCTVQRQLKPFGSKRRSAMLTDQVITGFP